MMLKGWYNYGLDSRIGSPASPAHAPPASSWLPLLLGGLFWLSPDSEPFGGKACPRAPPPVATVSLPRETYRHRGRPRSPPHHPSANHPTPHQHSVRPTQWHLHAFGLLRVRTTDEFNHYPPCHCGRHCLLNRRACFSSLRRGGVTDRINRICLLFLPTQCIVYE